MQTTPLCEQHCHPIFRKDLVSFLEFINPNGVHSKEVSQGPDHAPLSLENAVETIARRAIAEVSADVKAGVIPANVRTFSELHDYVDANDYGAAADWPCSLDADANEPDYVENFSDLWYSVATRVDQWIKDGMPNE